ncbi:MAG: acyl-CoA dehydrogenase family protein, partial [Planctomycetaceae bacterium]|nr:acyl-CoA dehydrogenase family protein [Planctomycetaceae bacterium]
LGITEAALLMHTIARSGAGFSGASAVHMNIFGLQPVIRFGTRQQQERFLPPLIDGREKACFAVTEPDAGLNTLGMKTFARRDGDVYKVSGQKLWISTAQVADRMLLLARTSTADDLARAGLPATRGLTLFYTRLDR